MKAIVIGGVAAGMSAASKLRRMMPDAEITVYEKGGYLSYGACGLPYYIGDTIVDQDSLTLQTPESLRRRLKLSSENRSKIKRLKQKSASQDV